MLWTGKKEEEDGDKGEDAEEREARIKSVLEQSEIILTVLENRTVLGRENIWLPSWQCHY